MLISPISIIFHVTILKLSTIQPKTSECHYANVLIDKNILLDFGLEKSLFENAL